MVFSTESGISIQGGGKELWRNHDSLPSQARAGDGIHLECLFHFPVDSGKPSGRAGTSHSRTNVVRGLFIFDGLNEVQKLHPAPPHSEANPPIAPFPSLGLLENLFPYFLPE